MRDNTIKITQAGIDKLTAEYKNLTETKRPGLVARLENARMEGDLKENSDFQNARDELEFLDGRISELKVVIENAQVVDGKNGNSTIAIGTMVTVKTNGSSLVFNLVGEWEADPMAKKISHSSPLGKALVGKKVGDKVEVEAPAGKITYEIVKVE